MDDIDKELGIDEIPQTTEINPKLLDKVQEEKSEVKWQIQEHKQVDYAVNEMFEKEISDELDDLNDATVFMRLDKIDKNKKPISTSSKLLLKLRNQVSKLQVLKHDSVMKIRQDGMGNFVYFPLPSRIIGGAIIKIGKTNFLLGQTRSSWFIIYDQPPERLYDTTPALMDVDLKRTDMAATPNGKILYLSTITRDEVNMLNNISAMESTRKGNYKETQDSLEIKEGETFFLEKTLEILKKHTTEYKSDIGFDIDKFVSKIVFMTPVVGAVGLHYYILIENDDLNSGEIVCELHVQKDPKYSEERFRDKVILYYKGKFSFLYIDEKD